MNCIWSILQTPIAIHRQIHLKQRSPIPKLSQENHADNQPMIQTTPNGKFPHPIGISCSGEQSMSPYVRLPETITCPMRLSGEPFAQQESSREPNKFLLSGERRGVVNRLLHLRDIAL